MTHAKHRKDIIARWDDFRSGAPFSGSFCSRGLMCMLSMFAVELFLTGAAIGQPLTPVVGTSPSELDFGSIPMGFRSTLDVQLSNRSSDPRSELRVIALDVSGRGYTLHSSPHLPDTLMGGESMPVSIQFETNEGGASEGRLTLLFANAAAAIVPLRGIGPPSDPPVQEEIALGEEKELSFKSIDGTFELRGGDVLHFRWMGGILFLNEMRYLPAPTKWEYEQFYHTRTTLARYNSIPYVHQRIGIYGNTDFGWRRAYAEWDSLTTDLTRVGFERYVSTQDAQQCLELVLQRDREQHNLIEWARLHPGGIEIRWKGHPISGGKLLLLNPSTQSPVGLRPRVPVPIAKAEALSTLSTLRMFLQGDGASRVDLKFGGFESWPAAWAPREGR